LAELACKTIKNLDTPNIRYKEWLTRSVKWLAAKSGNVKVLKWAIRNNFYSYGNWNDCLYKEVTKNGHIKVLELADRKELDWYSTQMLVNAVVRTDLELLDFILKKKPHEINLNFTRMCIAGGHIEVMESWKEKELVELFCDAAYYGQWQMLDSMYENGLQQKHPISKESIVDWAASGGQIYALELAQDQGMHGDAESCMWAAFNGHLHVLQWLTEDGAPWDSHVISCAEEHW
jgi:hypothetical protein